MLKKLFAGCLVVLFVLVAGSLALLAAYRSGIITKQMIMNAAGLGPADVEVDNFRDDAIQVAIQQLDAGKGQPASPTTLTIKSMNVTTFRTQTHGRYRVTFAAAGKGTLGECTLTLGSGDHYQFVPLPQRIVVNRLNRPASTGADLIVGRSSLCR